MTGRPGKWEKGARNQGWQPWTTTRTVAARCDVRAWQQWATVRSTLGAKAQSASWAARKLTPGSRVKCILGPWLSTYRATTCHV